MAQKNRITEAEWTQLLPHMATLAHITTDIGYSVLVKGEKASDVAARVGRSKQYSKTYLGSLSKHHVAY